MKRFALTLGSVLMVLSVALAAALWTMPTHNTETLRIDVQRGDTLNRLAQQWQQQGWLPSALLLRIQAKVLQQEHVLRVGEYDIPAQLSGTQLLRHLQHARPVSYTLTLIEGTTLREAIVVLTQAEGLQQDLEPLTPLTIARVLDVDGIAKANPEGWLYPDTYVYHRGDSVSAIVRQAHQRMQRELDQAWQNRQANLPYQRPYDVLIMASIIEKETGAAWEREDIAGVFVRRLQKNMRLQTDPTIIYGLGDEFKGNLRRVHLNDASNIYNSYRHHGLPPTPIALAGRAALQAAVNPNEGDSLFFVARGDGTHVFSATLADHNRAVRHYQINHRHSDYRSAPPAQPTAPPPIDPTAEGQQAP